VEAVLRTDQTSPLAAERKAYVVGETLIVRATPDDFTRVEELLNNRKITEAWRPASWSPCR
jgi:hypothetical protein